MRNLTPTSKCMETNPRKEFFDREAPHWFASDKDYTRTEKFKEWFLNIALMPGQSVLEIGPGIGTVLPWFFEAVGPTGRIVAFDLSAEMLNRAKIRCNGLPILFSQGEACHLTFQNEVFDRIFIINTFPHLTPQGIVLEELYRVLKTGGYLFVTHFCGRDYVNRIHAEVDEAVENDILLPASEMASLFQDYGFDSESCIENPDFYQISAKKSLTQRR